MMNFLEATDVLMDKRVMTKLAAALGVSESYLRVARVRGESGRAAPHDWQQAVYELAGKRISELSALMRELRRDRLVAALTTNNLGTENSSENQV